MSRLSTKMPLRSGWVTGNGTPHMRHKVGLGARRAGRWADDAAAGHVEVDHERQRAMALVLELMPRHFAGSRREVGGQSLQGLNVGQFIGTQRALTGLSAVGRRAIHRAHVSDLGVAVAVGGRGEPIPNSVWLQVGRFSTTAQRGVARCGR